MRSRAKVVVLILTGGMVIGALALGRAATDVRSVPRIDPAPKSRSSAVPLAPQRSASTVAAITGPRVVPAVARGSTPPIRTLPRPKRSARLTVRIEREPEHRTRLSSGRPDGALQSSVGSLTSPGLSSSFAGLTNDDNGVAGASLSLPPDTVGDVGPNRYVEMTNTVFAVYNKAGTKLAGPFPNSDLWQSLSASDLCRQNNDGDPIVVYDPFANRWLLTQFAWDDSPGNYNMCMAVSKTADPAGAYWAYDFLISTTRFNDYPKVGVWPDGYYVSFNDFGPSDYEGVTVAAFPRAKMVNGQAATGIKFSTNYPADDAYSLLPADFDGRLPPPAGSPEVFAEEAAPNRLTLFEFKANFVTPANSTFTRKVDLTTAPFDDQICADFEGFCIPQYDADDLLDALSDRLMHRLAYRNLGGGREALVVNHTVRSPDHGQAGVRWYELQKSGGAWSIRQQGTYAPNALNRWMGSAAMDGNRNIAVGYSVSSAAQNPSIRYAARLASDPLGQLEAERTIISGGGSQILASRWGDYSAMSIDPADDCTFWYVQEYYPTTEELWGWRTRVGSFRFPSCVGVSRLTPSSGPVGTSVAITGRGFTSASTVKFNGLTAARTYHSPTSLTAVAPSGATTGRVAVTTGSNTGVSPTNFTVTPSLAPTISSITTSGITGSIATINGTYLSGASAVKFNGKPSPAYTMVSPTKITAKVPDGATTGKISVTTPVGTAYSAGNFTVTFSITSFSPTSGPAGTLVTVNGVGFTPSTVLRLNGTVLTGFTYVGPTSVRGTVPSTATSGRITATNSAAPAGTVTSAGTFTKS